jgi:hypothetical protein
MSSEGKQSAVIISFLIQSVPTFCMTHSLLRWKSIIPFRSGNLFGWPIGSTTWNWPSYGTRQSGYKLILNLRRMCVSCAENKGMPRTGSIKPIIAHSYRRFMFHNFGFSRSQWPRGLRRRSAAERLLGSWVRIQPGAWMFASCECSCCQAEVSATGRSVVQRSPTDWGVCLSVIKWN